MKVFVVNKRRIKANTEYGALMKYQNDSMGYAICKDGKGRWVLDDFSMLTHSPIYAIPLTNAGGNWNV